MLYNTQMLSTETKLDTSEPIVKPPEPPKTPVETLAAMEQFVVSNLAIYVESVDLLNSLPATLIDDILAAYHISYLHILKLHSNYQETPIDTITLNQYPAAKIIITRKKEIFKALYHSPHRFDNLPDWVRSYVNFRSELYVFYLPENEIIPSRLDIAEGSHEFNHITLANILSIPTEYLADFWPTYLNEYVSVSLNQRAPDGWLALELTQANKEVPTIEGIKLRGWMTFDSRPPQENIAYQYCVIVGDALGEAIKAAHLDDPYMARTTPLYALFIVTQQAYHSGISFFDALEKLGINLETVENTARAQHGLPALTYSTTV